MNEIHIDLGQQVHYTLVEREVELRHNWIR